MSLYATLSKVCALGGAIQSAPKVLAPTLSSVIGTLQPVRYRRAKHWAPKWKSLRYAKVQKLKLPDYQKKLTEDEQRQRMKEAGVYPQKLWSERQAFISCTGGIIEEYVPPEGDGKFSNLSTAGAKQQAELLLKKSKAFMSVRKIRTYEEDFTVKTFPQQAQEIYIKAHEAMVNKNEDDLRMYVTERAFPMIKHNSEDKTIHWKFLESLEPPRVVAVKHCSIISEKNFFAQVTVRFHSQQLLAIYDRFGRLMSGSEILKKDVLEYVVFEKHLVSQYGCWRIHGKILPAWAPPREYGDRTYIQEKEEPQAEEKMQEVSTVVGSTEVDKASQEPKSQTVA